MKKYELTKEQRALIDGMPKLAKKLELFVRESGETPSDDLVNKAREIEEFEKSSRKARIMVGQHAYASYADFLKVVHKEVSAFKRKLNEAYKNTANSNLVFRGEYQY